MRLQAWDPQHGVGLLPHPLRTHSCGSCSSKGHPQQERGEPLPGRCGRCRSPRGGSSFTHCGVGVWAGSPHCQRWPQGHGPHTLGKEVRARVGCPGPAPAPPAPPWVRELFSALGCVFRTPLGGTGAERSMRSAGMAAGAHAPRPAAPPGTGGAHAGLQSPRPHRLGAPAGSLPITTHLLWVVGHRVSARLVWRAVAVTAVEVPWPCVCWLAGGCVRPRHVRVGRDCLSGSVTSARPSASPWLHVVCIALWPLGLSFPVCAREGGRSGCFPTSSPC